MLLLGGCKDQVNSKCGNILQTVKCTENSSPLLSHKPGVIYHPTFSEYKGKSAHGCVQLCSMKLTSNSVTQGYLGLKQNKESMAKNEELILSALALPSKLCCKKGLAEKRIPDGN